MCPNHLPPADRLPASYSIISSWIEPNSEVLDLGCGNGDLLAYLQKENGCQGEGVELDRELVGVCNNRGLPVHHGNIDEGLGDYPDQRFDVVTLSQTLQEVMHPERVITEILRVGKLAIITFPNFGYWRGRLQLCLTGRAPKTTHLPYSWFDSPNRRFLTIADFNEFCDSKGISVVKTAYLAQGTLVRFWPNIMAETAIAAIQRKP